MERPVRTRCCRRLPVLAGCLTALVTTAPLGAQEEEDVLHLKDGDIVRGSIIEHIPGESLKIQTEGGVLVYPIDQIGEVSREPVMDREEGKTGLHVEPKVWIWAGDRVRVTVQGGAMTGTVLWVNESGFGLDPWNSRPISVMYKDIRRLERSLARKNHWKAGLAVGACPGVLITLLGSAVVEEGGEEVGVVILGGGLLIAGAGGLLGMAIGALINTEDWEPIPMRRIDQASIGGDRRAVLAPRPIDKDLKGRK